MATSIGRTLPRGASLTRRNIGHVIPSRRCTRGADPAGCWDSGTSTPRGLSRWTVALRSGLGKLDYPTLEYSGVRGTREFQGGQRVKVVTVRVRNDACCQNRCADKLLTARTCRSILSCCPSFPGAAGAPRALVGMLSAHRMSGVVSASASVGARSQQVTDNAGRTFYWQSAMAS